MICRATLDRPSQREMRRSERFSAITIAFAKRESRCRVGGESVSAILVT